MQWINKALGEFGFLLDIQNTINNLEKLSELPCIYSYFPQPYSGPVTCTVTINKIPGRMILTVSGLNVTKYSWGTMWFVYLFLKN